MDALVFPCSSLQSHILLAAPLSKGTISSARLPLTYMQSIELPLNCTHLLRSAQEVKQAST